MSKIFPLSIFIFLLSIFLIYPVPETKAEYDFGNKNIFIIKDDGSLITSSGFYDSNAIADKFYNNNTDNYDFLIIVTNYDIPDKPNYLVINRNISGIGPNLNAIRNKTPHLMGILNMKNIASFETNKKNEIYYMDWPRTIVHEFMHHWGMYLNRNGNGVYGIISDGGVHWSRNVLLPSTLMGGNNIQYWRDDGSGYAIRSNELIDNDLNMFTDPLFLYLAGFVCPNELSGVKYYVVDPEEIHESKAKIIGYITIDDIIKNEEERVPGCNNAKRDFKAAIIFLLKQGTEATTIELEKVKILAGEIPNWWALSTQNRSTIQTTLQPLPMCSENDWVYTLSPQICPSIKMQTKKWEKTGHCDGGAVHQLIEKFECGSDSQDTSTTEKNSYYQNIKLSRPNEASSSKISANVSGDKISSVELEEKKLVTKVDNNLAKRMSGRILLQIEKNGEAWYVDPKSLNKFFLADGTSAYGALRRFGLGITNKELAKIPIGIEKRFLDIDTDEDGLADKLEEALGTDPKKVDTDDDGYSDLLELNSFYNPAGSGKLVYEIKMSERMKGLIVLQVEGRGEAWYIDPKDNKRYYMKDGNAAYQIMKYLSVGITNENIRKIGVGAN
jgi:hypothetical protein